MHTANYNVLIVDDQAIDRAVLAKMLTSASAKFTCTMCANLDGAIAALSANTFDICIADFHLDDFTAIDLIQKIQTIGCNTPVLVVTGSGDMNLGLEVIKAGANDFFPKDELSPILLCRTVQHVLVRHRAMLEVRQEASEDWLTLTTSRRHFERAASNELSIASDRGVSVSLLLIDIDNLKKTNDAYGHQSGDELLKAVSVAIREKIRKVDLLARWGGDEFCVLLVSADNTIAMSIGKQVIDGVAQLELNHEGSTITSTVSVGVASTNTEQPCGLSELFRIADGALYEAKSAGRNRVVNGAKI